MSRARVADAILADVFRKLPKDAPEEAVNKAIFDAYPFGERRYHPYKVWLDRVRHWKAMRSKLRSWEGLPLDTGRAS